ncbi:hypothetical protein ACFLZN_02260 [Nanoarchaeota archaeon]
MFQLPSPYNRGFSLLSVFLFLNEKSSYISAIPFLVFGMMGLLHTIVAFLVIISLPVIIDRKINHAVIFSLFITFLYNVYYLFVEEAAEFISIGNIEQFIFELGGSFGLFYLLFSLMGLYFLWQYKRQFYFAFATLFGIGIYSFFYIDASIYTNLSVVILTGTAISKLLKRKWQLPVVKYFFILIFILTLVFTVVSAIKISNGAVVNNELKDALLFLNERGDSDDVVFTHFSLGHYVQAYADKKVLLHNAPAGIKNVDEIYVDSLEFFHTYEKEALTRLIEKYNIRYVLLKDDFNKGLVWEKEGRGLQYTILSSGLFNKIYDEEGIQIYEAKI